MANYTIDKIKYGNDTYIIKDSNASTTDNKVSLTADSTNEFLPVTFKKGTTSPAGIYYNDNIKVNPSTGTVNATAAKFVNLGADKGIFNKLIATTADIESLDVNNLTATNAKVVGMLDVQGDLHTNSWTNANMANIGGSFYISPTIAPTDGSTTITINRVSATSWTVQLSGTFATDFIKSGTSSTGVNWPANSLVLVTGNVTLNNMVYPLGTLKGTLSSAVTASAASTSKTITITGVVDGQGGNTPYVLQELYELNGNANLTTKAFTNGKISLYQLGSFPIGIQLSSMGVDSNSIIDIYGGVKSTPTVRIGHLAGLPAVNGQTPTGWGIYTDNGYFTGVIVSTAGKIGGFTIGSIDLYNGTLGATNSVWMSTGTSSSASIGGSNSIANWAFTASNQFGVTKTGELWANLAHIKGSIDATSFQARDGSGNIRAVVDSNGLTVKDAAGNMVAAFSGSGVSFSSSVSQKIGNNTNYIEFNPTTNRINIIGSGVYFGSTPIDDVATTDKIDTAISNIEIGGRNLLIGASALTENTPYTLTTSATDGYSYIPDVSTDIKVLTGESYVIQAKTDGIWSNKHGSQAVEYVTLWLVGGTEKYAHTYHMVCLTSPNGNPGYLGDGKWKWTVPSSWNECYVCLRVNNYNTDGTTSVTHNYWDFKLERGNQATDWTPAPEDVDSNIQDVSDELTTSISGTPYYQYTLNGTTYDVWYDESTDKYYYRNTNGTQTEVAYANLDKADGEPIVIRKNGLNDKVISLTSNVSFQEGQISQIDKTVGDHTTLIGKQDSEINGIKGEQALMQKDITDINDNLDAIGDELKTYRKGITIDTQAPFIKVWSETTINGETLQGSVTVTPTGATVKGAGNQVSWFDSQSFNSERMVAQFIKPRYMEFNDDGTTTMQGTLTLIGRSNKHLSIIKTLT